MEARQEILARIRGAAADAPTATGAAPAEPLTAPEGAPSAGTLDLFVEKVADYRAEVLRVGAGDLAEAIAGTLEEHACRSIIIPEGVDSSWTASLGDRVAVRGDGPGLTAQDLDTIDAVLTGAAVGIAATGTIVLDHGPGQGRRALTLVPDTHVCVIHDEQVVPDVPDAVARLRPGRGRQPLTWVSGPSATSDIELERVEGVHGPRTLVVILVSA